MNGARTLLVGYGWWGKVLESAMLAQDTGLQLCGIVSLEEESNRSGVQMYQDYEYALAELDPTVVILATPHQLHPLQIEWAAEAGCHIYCEKPLALSTREAKRAIAACKASNVVLTLGFQRCAWPSFRKLQELLASGQLGELRLLEGNYSNNTAVSRISGSWRKDKQQTPGPIGFTGMGIHPLDQMVSLAGPLSTASSQVREASSVALRFEKGAVASLNWMQGTPEYYRLAVFGSRGWAELTGPAAGRWQLDNGEIGSLAEGNSSFDDVLENLRLFSSSLTGNYVWPVSETVLLHTAEAFEKVIDACSREEAYGDK